MTGKGSGRRGRPLGYKLSEASKRAISAAKKGQRHKLETREKISRSLLLYFRKKTPLSEELSNRYHRIIDRAGIQDWIDNISLEFDASFDVMTEKAVRNKSKIELNCGDNIEYFSHGFTPELIYLFKEHCFKEGVDPEDLMEEIDSW